MIREFRAWDEKNKSFITNDDEFKEYMIGLDGKLYRMDFYSGVSGHENGNLIWNELKDIILIQFTGLLDKNDKKIYEGDIIHFSKYNQKHNESDQGIGIVKFDEFDYLYGLRLEDCKQIKPKPSGFFRGLGDLGSCEIIGNIYENPELIRGGK